MKPYLRRNMERRDLHGHDNLCSTIQEMYFLAESEELRVKCCIAMRCSKFLDQRLRAYKAKYEPDRKGAL